MAPPPAKKAKSTPPAPASFLKRIQCEVKDAAESNMKKLGYKLELVGNDYSTLRAEIFGSIDTPYEGGHFVLNINVPVGYPYKPPEVKFATRIWHPNVSSVTGAICLDILKDKWSIMLNLRTVLVSLQALLSDPVPDDPQDAVVASQMLRNKAMFEKTARHWTNKYAGGKGIDEDCEKKEADLVRMGYSEQKVRTYLSQNDWDVTKATNALMDD